LKCLENQTYPRRPSSKQSDYSLDFHSDEEDEEGEGQDEDQQEEKRISKSASSTKKNVPQRVNISDSPSTFHRYIILYLDQFKCYVLKLLKENITS